MRELFWHPGLLPAARCIPLRSFDNCVSVLALSSSRKDHTSAIIPAFAGKLPDASTAASFSAPQSSYPPPSFSEQSLTFPFYPFSFLTSPPNALLLLLLLHLPSIFLTPSFSSFISLPFLLPSLLPFLFFYLFFALLSLPPPHDPQSTIASQSFGLVFPPEAKLPVIFTRPHQSPLPFSRATGAPTRLKSRLIDGQGPWDSPQ